MVELNTERKSLETMPVLQPQGHCSFIACFPLTVAAFAAAGFVEQIQSSLKSAGVYSLASSGLGVWLC